eukprot:CAMPEP_0172439488 /NCGR_PEP_ID=MMETSP1065-20121228/458_1 /TAXON_ID=265537 /ORGANISM="Amphiprora paludosa, Strain CCMP125" /LENGTH=449 /DNA_ID=CAMNT_0013188175 /DNA_START=107 /DNA_END=1456 /DNA_ORIENTATION=-
MPRNQPEDKYEQPDEEPEEDETIDEENVAPGEVTAEWAGGTSIHGVALASDSGNYSLWFRIMWMILIIGAGVIMVWQIESLISEYRNFDVSTNVDTLVPESLEFPQITICNSNQLSAVLKNVTGIEEPANEEELKLLTLPLEASIWLTEFNGVDLNVTEAWTSVVTDFGACWQFTTDERVFRPGAFGGLYLWYYLNQDDYESFTELAGIQVFALQPGIKITDQTPFITISPGQEGIVSLTKTQYGREQEAPWARCFSKAPEYTQTQCRDDCINKAGREKCGCRAWGDTTPEAQDLRYCQYSNNETSDYDCLIGLNETAEQEKCVADPDTPDCTRPPCQVTIYDAVETGVPYGRLFLESLEQDAGLTEQEFNDNFIGVNINFDKILFTELTETKAVTFAQLLGSIGGSMGLFMGISALSVFELFGDLICLRLIPRFFGYRHLYGLGHRRG